MCKIMENKKREVREVREGAFILYFEKLFRNDPLDEIFEITKEAGADELNISLKSLALAKNIDEKAEDLDAIIAEYSKKEALRESLRSILRYFVLVFTKLSTRKKCL